MSSVRYATVVVRRWCRCAVAAALVSFAFWFGSPTSALAEPGVPPATDEEDEAEAATLLLARSPDAILLATPGFGVTLEGQAGFSLLVESDESSARVIAGALARMRWGLFQVGGTFEQSSTTLSHWRALGGFAGVWLPYRKWLDIDFAAGLASRTHSNDDMRYGPDGYTLSSPAFTLRAGVSDRAPEGLLGARLGAALVAMIDLRRHTPAWRYTFASVAGQTPREVTGVSQVGGFSLGMLFTLGIDVEEPP